jgi:acyl carrier protein
MYRTQVIQSIYDAIRRMNDFRPPAEQLACAEATTLYGREGPLDSLGLVSFILDVEEAVNAQTGRNLVLADERAMAQHRNPFRTVRSLADYVVARLEGNQCPTAAPS